MHGETTSNNELFKIITEAKVDDANQKQYRKVSIAKNNQELAEVRYLQTGELYALASNQIVTKYVAIENNQLKEFAKKLGYQDTSSIPDKIQGTTDLNTLLKLTEEEKSSILKKYGKLVVDNINKNHFSKSNKVTITMDGKNYNTNQYTLNLTTEEIKNLLIMILQQLHNDEQTLNILLNKYTTVMPNEEMTVESLRQEIQQLEQTLNEKQIENVGIQISLYVSDNQLIKTQITINEMILSIQYISGARENKVVIQEESNLLEGFNRIELTKSEEEDKYVLSVTLSHSQDTQNTIALQISRVGNANSTTIRKLDILTIKVNGGEYSLKYNDNINFENEVEIEELNSENSITLNQSSQEELQQLIPAIMLRTTEVWRETCERLIMNPSEIPEVVNQSQPNEDQSPEENEGEQQNQNPLSETEKLAIDMYNEQFVAYLGDNIQANQAKQLLNVVKTAVQNQNVIVLKFKGTYNNTPIEKEVTTIEELENLEIYMINGKTYKIQGLADTTGKLEEITIEENTNNT